MANFPPPMDETNFPRLQDSIILYDRKRGRSYHDTSADKHDQYTLILELHYTTVTVHAEADAYIVLSQSTMASEEDHTILAKLMVTTKKYQAATLKRLDKINTDEHLTLATITIIDNGGLCFDRATPEHIDAEDWDQVFSTVITATKARDAELYGEFDIIKKSEAAGADGEEDDESLVVVLRPPPE